MNRWLSLCCGLDATVAMAMDPDCRILGKQGKRPNFVPIPRMGGKRAYADHVLDLLEHWPEYFVMVDVDPAISLFWRFAFAGRLPEVAEIIRSADRDGEELWKWWGGGRGLRFTVPEDPAERLARWVVLQKGNFSGKPVSMKQKDGKLGWSGLAGWKTSPPQTADVPHVIKAEIAAKLEAFKVGNGEALELDLAQSAPRFRPGDVVTLDPPYRGRTGYGAHLPRQKVIDLARAAHEAGARVLIHEGEPLPMGEGWQAVELRRSVAKKQRTWSAPLAEFATVNFKPGRRLRRRMGPINGPLFDQ